MKSSLAIIIGVLSVGPLHAGVYAHYSFDTDYTDSSGNGRDGTLTDVGTIGNSGIITTAGNHMFGGGAMDFADEADYIALPSKTFPSGVAYSIAFWAQRDSTANQWNMVIGDQTTNFFIALQNNNTLRWRSSSSAANRQQDFTAPTDTAWHHYAITASGTTITFYMDGALVNAVPDKLTGFIIDGIGSAYPAANGFDFRGRLDEVWIFDEAISAAKVSALYASNNPNAVPAYAGFHHRYDGNFNDSSGAGNNGTPVGGATITTDPAAIASGAGALALDGADGSYVTLPGLGTFAADKPWTAAFWAKRDAIGDQKGMVMGGGANSSDFIWLNDNFTGLRFRSSNSTTFDFTAPKDSALRHYALVADGLGNLSLYMDGQFSQSLTGDTSFGIDTIGMAYPTTSLHYNFQGSLDEIHVIPSALGAAQIEQLYNMEKPKAPVTRLRIVLLGGQSNADGRAAIADLPTSPVNLQNPQNDVDLFYKIQGGTATLTTLRPGLTETSQFGPDITLGRKMADLWADETGTRLAIIKYANGGTNLYSQWKAGGDATTTGDGPEYITFQQTVNLGLAALAAAYPGATLDLQGMVWMQGESDNSASAAAAYQANLTAFIADIRATYGADLPFTIARLGSGQTAVGTYLGQLRAAQEAVAAADPRTGLLSTDGFGMNSDALHFNAAGQQAMGGGFAEITAYYEWMVGTFSAADINAGLAEPEADRDGDGQTNITEFLGATDPLAGSSVFAAVFAPTGPGVGTISYPSSTARFYSVQHFLDVGGTWETVQPASRGTGAVVVIPLNTPDPRGIYRVRSTLP